MVGTLLYTRTQYKLESSTLLYNPFYIIKQNLGISNVPTGIDSILNFIFHLLVLNSSTKYNFINQNMSIYSSNNYFMNIRWSILGKIIFSLIFLIEYQICILLKLNTNQI